MAKSHKGASGEGNKGNVQAGTIRRMEGMGIDINGDKVGDICLG